MKFRFGVVSSITLAFNVSMSSLFSCKFAALCSYNICWHFPCLLSGCSFLWLRAMEMRGVQGGGASFEVSFFFVVVCPHLMLPKNKLCTNCTASAAKKTKTNHCRHFLRLARGMLSLHWANKEIMDLRHFVHSQYIMLQAAGCVWYFSLFSLP